MYFLTDLLSRSICLQIYHLSILPHKRARPKLLPKINWLTCEQPFKVPHNNLIAISEIVSLSKAGQVVNLFEENFSYRKTSSFLKTERKLFTQGSLFFPSGGFFPWEIFSKYKTEDRKTFTGKPLLFCLHEIPRVPSWWYILTCLLRFCCFSLVGWVAKNNL